MKIKITVLTLLCLIVGILIGSEVSKTDLEIYTVDNIYFVEGLRVSNEANDKVIHFTNKSELKEYIGEISAKN
jgi:hypothetical protein